MHNWLHPALSCVMCSEASKTSSFSLIAQIQICVAFCPATPCLIAAHRLHGNNTVAGQLAQRGVPCSASSLGNQLLCDAQEGSDGCAVTSLFQAGHLDVRANVAALDRQPDD